MSSERLSNTYARRVSRFQSAIHHHARLMNLLSFSRLLALGLLGWTIIMGVRQDNLAWYGLGVVALAGFLILVTLFNRQKELRELNRHLKELNERERTCLNHDYQDSPRGDEFMDVSHPWSNDLDIFGKGSLYQYMNRTITLEGARILAGILTTEPGAGSRQDGQPGQDVQGGQDAQGGQGGTDVIGTRLDINRELKELVDFRQYFTATGAMIREEPGDLQGIRQWLDADAYITRNRWLFLLAVVISLVTVTIIIMGIIDPGWFWYLLGVLFFNFTLLSPFVLRTNRYQQTISRKHALLEGYARLLKIIADTRVEHPELKERREMARQGMKEVRRLSRLLNIFDQRLNMLLGSVFNGLFLFDFIMLHLLERWKRRHREQVMDWIGVTGWTDAYVSLSGFAYNHPGFAWPEIGTGSETMVMTEMGHPLIAPGKRVVNNLTVNEEKVVIITGANMAGKSTFLRSVGVNTVLAYAGCPVCATTFRTGYTGLFSSMRTADSLADDESYFLAEIRKLQRIVNRMVTGQPMLILLDEVLKGTNTTDKKRGSVGLIRRALDYPVHCFIATHDLSLGELEQEHPGRVVNYCFESYIKDLELEFDYTIRQGIATSMNASFLMKRMGIME